MKILCEFTIPTLFWDDHFERCGDHDGVRRVIRKRLKTVTVKLDREALIDLASDADLYATPGQFDLRDYASLVRSARATVESLRRQGALDERGRVAP